MNFQKLVTLFSQEKNRIIKQVYNPILTVINDQKYTDFFNYRVAALINEKIEQEFLEQPFIDLLNETDFEKLFNSVDYKKLYDDVIKRILETAHFDPFILVFGKQNYAQWALNFYKYLEYEYFKMKGLTNVKQRLTLGQYDKKELIRKVDFDNLIDINFKNLYGYTLTFVSTFEFWQRTAKIAEKTYGYFLDIVNENNPTPYLINSFLYFTKWNKHIKDNNHFHKYRSFTTAPQQEIEDLDFAKEWIINYLATITLNSKITTGLWLAIQNLVFGTQKGRDVVVMRTVSNINLNIKVKWQLDKDAIDKFNLLKMQCIFQVPKPKTFDLFLAQSADKIKLQLKPLTSKYKSLISSPTPESKK